MYSIYQFIFFNFSFFQNFKVKFVFGYDVLEFERTGFNCSVYKVEAGVNNICDSYINSNPDSYNPKYLYQVNGIAGQSCKVTASTGPNGPSSGDCFD